MASQWLSPKDHDGGRLNRSCLSGGELATSTAQTLRGLARALRSSNLLRMPPCVLLLKPSSLLHPVSLNLVERFFA